ncbi:MAG: hypothetical protein IPM97_14995 [Bdellovibrionaceae bacterium]|nr:hypothetical protein [Pseudobdellovibrionaceae bacterium]
MRTLIFTLLMTLILGEGVVYAHGEDKLGPNGGFIRMPGAFHTEVLPLGANKLKVYLLDINWENPSVLNSSLRVSLRSKKTSQAKCEVQENYYLCEFPMEVNLTKRGELSVEAQRENQKGNMVSYELPLKLQVIDDGHGGHQ